MSIYNRIKTLLLEVSARNNPDVIGRIARRKAFKNQKSLAAGADYKTSPDHRLAKKYNSKHTKMVGSPSQSIRATSRIPGKKNQGFHGT